MAKSELHFKRLVEELNVSDNVSFAGEISDAELIRAYQQCDLFVLPNREVDGDFEGFGMVLLEAQACGRPVLAGDSGGTAETMKRGETGLIVDCTSPEPLAEAVIDLLSNPTRLEQMGEAARTWVLERFDWSALAHRPRVCFAFPTVGWIKSCKTKWPIMPNSILSNITHSTSHKLDHSDIG